MAPIRVGIYIYIYEPCPLNLPERLKVARMVYMGIPDDGVLSEGP